MIPYFKKETRGSGRPRVAVVACMHGDELIGKKVIESLKKIPLLKGELGLFLAHPEAVRRKKRALYEDLNRSFPGKAKGNFEERLALKLRQELKTYDVVIDIHGTNSKIDSLAVITKTTPSLRRLLSHLPIRKIALILYTPFQKKALIHHVPLGFSLEYGPTKEGKKYRLALRHTKALLAYCGIISGKVETMKKKELFEVTDTYKIPRGFEENPQLKEFKLITKGSVIGKLKGLPFLAEKSFYPLFLGKGRYRETLALVSQKKNITFPLK